MKINIKYQIKTDTTITKGEVVGSLIDNIISYNEDRNTDVFLDINKNEFVRENNEVVIKYTFNRREETKGYVFIKALNNSLDVIINTLEINNKDNEYYVHYKAEDSDIEYSLIYTEA